mmetsp:Transcript_49144/g.59568  ORF Transcript_49144/g.59568 Transcript_49144/m.59568 type:complete len:108 (-) Transcript_49144:114-437(-)
MMLMGARGVGRSVPFWDDEERVLAAELGVFEKDLKPVESSSRRMDLEGGGDEFEVNEELGLDKGAAGGFEFEGVGSSSVKEEFDILFSIADCARPCVGEFKSLTFLL